MDIIIIIIIIVIIILLIAASYSHIKYYYLKNYKPQEFITYANEKFLMPELNNFNLNLITLNGCISNLGDSRTQITQKIEMSIKEGLNLYNKTHETVENTLYNSIEQSSNNCMNNIKNIQKYITDIHKIKRYSNNEILTIPQSIIIQLTKIRNEFKNSLPGFLRIIEDGSKMSKELELKEKCVKLINDISESFKKLNSILNPDLTKNEQIDKPIEVKNELPKEEIKPKEEVKSN